MAETARIAIMDVMNRVLLPLLLAFGLPAHAWEFTPVPVCTLKHETDAVSVRVTHDPQAAEPYAIEITRPLPWPSSDGFAVRFDGPLGMTITTDRHSLSNGGTTLTVTDRGFGNVLDGIEFNRTATAIAGDAAVAIPLDGAASPMQAFRACLLPAAV